MGHDRFWAFRWQRRGWVVMPVTFAALSSLPRWYSHTADASRPADAIARLVGLERLTIAGNQRPMPHR